MRYLVVIAVVSFLTGCNSDSGTMQQFYKATSKENKAILSLTLEKDQFYGYCKVHYTDGIVDSGQVRGIVAGDTLRGRFSYSSYGGNKEVKPFLLLKRGDTLKLGSGAVYKYMKIPYYTPESIEFKSTDFQFLPIQERTFKKLDLDMK